MILFLMNFLPLTMVEVEAIDNNTYGIVNFKTKGCNETTSYVNVANNKEGYTNGCYGADAAFLGYNSNKSQVKFKMAGVTGWVDAKQVEVIDYMANFDKLYTSNYTVKNGILQHITQTDIKKYEGGAKLSLGPKPSFLSEGSSYWSYDGHYFYPATKSGYQVMINDYRAGHNNNAINKNNPYYNYYQYLSHRTQSNYTASDILNYLKSRGFSSPMTSYPAASGQSLLYGEQTSFVQYQNEFGANLGLVLGLAMNESASGTSSIAFHGKNLFGHAAFDSSPGASATSYLSVAQSIYAHTKFYISEGYLDPCDWRNSAGAYDDATCHKGRYNGAHMGDKASGLNVKYASDPYWGDKAAQFYYLMDSALGMQDYNKYTIAIKQNATSWGVRKEPTNDSPELYKSGPITDYPVVVLETVTGQSINGNNKWYKIQTDPVLNSDRTKIVQDSGAYNYKNNYGYVHSSGFRIVNTGKAIKNRYNITFHANGGTYTDGTTGSKTLTLEQNVVPEINSPTKAGDTFMGWSPTIMGASSDVTYTALWKNTKYNITFDANGGIYSDQSTSKVVSVSAGTKPSVETPTRSGYTFKGWDKTITNATENTTYRAVWEKDIVYYSIIFDANGGAFDDGSKTVTQKVKEGMIPTVSVPSREGYEFLGWSSEISPASENKTYLAKWEKTVIYDITFEANDGVFQNGKDTKVVPTIKGQVPTVETPMRDGFLFTGWDPVLTKASENTTYTATWKEGTIEDVLTQKSGKFYLDHLKVVGDKLQIKGYHAIMGIDNDLKTDIQYELVLVNQTTGKEYRQSLERLTDEKQMTIPVLSTDGKNYKYSWFKSSISFVNIPQGDYTAYLRSSTDTYYAKSYVQNILLNEQATDYTEGRRAITITNNYMDANIPLEFTIRDKRIGNKETSYDVNQYSLVEKLKFEDKQLHIVAATYSVGLDMRKTTTLQRELIFENIETFEQTRISVGSLLTPVYPIQLINADQFGKSKDRAWFDKTIDISDLDKGTYAIYVTNESNISDYGELYDVLFADLSNAKTVMNGKQYTFQLNESKRNRIELIVK